VTRPDPNPDTGGRPLAEILREAGIDMSRANRRRRWNDPDWEDPVPQRRRDPETDPGTGGSYGRRRSDREPDSAGRGFRAQNAQRPPDPSTEAIPGLRATGLPSVPIEPLTGPMTGPTGRSPRVRQRRPEPAREPAREPAPDPAPALTRSATRTAHRPEPLDEHPSTGPIPIATDLEDEEVGGREGALAWLRFVGELVIALGVGVGVYFAFTVLWEMLPYLAVVAAPVVVAGLVGGVAMWRHRMGREQMGVRLLAVLVFAGTLLAIAPAAGLLSGP
jgi:hypothetical protein